MQKAVTKQQVPARTDITADDISTIIYTSGTTGKPKGVELSHRNVCGVVHGTNELYRKHDAAFLEQQVSLAYLPWAHVYGMTCEVHQLTSTGNDSPSYFLVISLISWESVLAVDLPILSVDSMSFFLMNFSVVVFVCPIEIQVQRVRSCPTENRFSNASSSPSPPASSLCLCSLTGYVVRGYILRCYSMLAVQCALSEGLFHSFSRSHQL